MVTNSNYLFEMPDGTIIEYDRDNMKESEKEWLIKKGYTDVTDEFLEKCRVYSKIARFPSRN